jgi:hypothetical protein
MADKKERELSDLVAPFVALCKSGANKKVFFLKKSEEEEMADKESLLKISQMVQKADLPEEALEKINNIKNKNGEDLEAEEIEALKAALKMLIALKGKIGDKIMGELSTLSEIDGPSPRYGYPMAQGTGGNVKKDEKGNDVPENDKEKFEIEVEKSKKAMKEKDEEIEKIKKALKDKEEQIEKLGKEVAPPANAAAQKCMTPVKKSDGSYEYPENFSKEQIAMLEPILKKNDELEASLAKEQADKIQKEFIAKASEIKNLGVKKEDLAEILKTVNEKISKEMEDKIFAILKGADASSENLFTENGHSESIAKLDAEKMIDSKVEAIMKSEDGKGLTKEQAYMKALEANPELYEQYEKETETR